MKLDIMFVVYENVKLKLRALGRKLCSGGGGCLLRGGGVPGGDPPPRTATFAGGTHPTRMHSCLTIFEQCCVKNYYDLGTILLHNHIMYFLILIILPLPKQDDV